MKKNQKGFVLTLAILMLVVMSIMGLTLVTLLSNDVKQNVSQDEYQQALYTAETGANVGKLRLQNLVTASRSLPQAQAQPWNTNTAPNWCSPRRFAKVMNQNPSQIFIVDSQPINPRRLLGNELNQPATSLTPDELNRFNRYEFYYFITNAPSSNGNAPLVTNPTQILSIQNSKIASGGVTGTSVAERTAYRSNPGGGAQEYTIYACGRNIDSNVVAAIDLTITLSMQ